MPLASKVERRLHQYSNPQPDRHTPASFACERQGLTGILVLADQHPRTPEHDANASVHLQGGSERLCARDCLIPALVKHVGVRGEIVHVDNLTALANHQVLYDDTKPVDAGHRATSNRSSMYVSTQGRNIVYVEKIVVET